MKTQSLKLQDVVTTAGTQIRAKIDAEAVADYAEAMTEGAKFPPVIVFHDGTEYILADGFHRVMAAARNGFKDILSEIHKGTKADALKYALGANCAHGIKRTNADKRRSVELALTEWPKLSDAEIARVCAVSQPFVGEVRKSIQPITVIGSTRIGSDGKERKMPTPKAPVEPQLETPIAKAERVIAAAVQPVRKLSEFERGLADDLDIAVADLRQLQDDILSGDSDPNAFREAKANLAILSKKLGQYEKSLAIDNFSSVQTPPRNVHQAADGGAMSEGMAGASARSN